MKHCKLCERDLSPSLFKHSNQCSVCVSGRQRFGALARARPHLLFLRLDVQRFIREYETARRASTRALRSIFGIEVTWRGVEVARVKVLRLHEFPPGLPHPSGRGGEFFVYLTGLLGIASQRLSSIGAAGVPARWHSGCVERSFCPCSGQSLSASEVSSL